MLEPTSLVLVAVVNDPRDMEIARLLGWYRIPLRSAPKVVFVDYLAFYQTGAFGEAKWQIQFIAPVMGHELTTRRELLKDEPSHPRAKEEYYKLQIGPLESLPKPVRADRWRRITFLYTTGEYLMQAETINDLVVRTEERKILWQALRERAESGYGTAGVPEIDIPEEVLALLLGIRELEESYATRRSKAQKRE